MVIPISDRLKGVEDYYFVKKLEQIAQLNKSGKKVINLGIGSPDLAPSDETIEELNKISKLPNAHGYQPYRGIQELRVAISEFYKKFYNVTLNPENEILPLMGSKEGIIHISMAFLNKGDSVWVPDPGYPTYTSNAKLVQAKVIRYDLKIENNWHPDINQLEKQWQRYKPKLMWLNYPHMPTGARPNVTVLREIIQFAEQKKCLVINDNPYSLVLNESSPFSIFQLEGSRSVCLELNSLSKSFNMAGWRVGMLVGLSDYLSAVLRVKSNIDSGMFLPIQKAAVVALSNADYWHSQRNKMYEERRNHVFKLYDLLECEYDKNQMGMFVWAKLPRKNKNSLSFSDKILEKSLVFITPGDIFGKNGRGYLRISLCSNVENIQLAYERIKQSLR
jgi:aspartate/methionine/tyrosine aminotransferase